VEVLSRDDEPAGHLVGAEMAEVVRAHVGLGVAGEHPGVFGRDVEVHLVAGVRRRGLGKVAGQLAEVLVGQGERQVVAAGLGQHVVERAGEREEVLVMPSA
jgi:hypothetical protein